MSAVIGQQASMLKPSPDSSDTIANSAATTVRKIA
jgi:hypothetical protein